MPTLYAKTDAGQREIRERTHALPRGARTLLLLADGTKDSEQLLAMVRGAAPEDLASLLQLGLLAEQRSTARSASLRPAAAAEPGPADAPAALAYGELYESMTQLVKSQLGLVKALKYTLDIEKAGSTAALQGVAHRFAAEVESAKGENAANMVRRALGLAQ